MAVLTILLGIGSILLGIVFVVAGAMVAAFLSGFLGGLGVIAGLIFVLVGILVLTAGFGLLRLRKWAWWLAIIAFVLGFLSSGLSASYVGAAIDLLLIIYLVLVRKHFM